MRIGRLAMMVAAVALVQRLRRRGSRTGFRRWGARNTGWRRFA